MRLPVHISVSCISGGRRCLCCLCQLHTSLNKIICRLFNISFRTSRLWRKKLWEGNLYFEGLLVIGLPQTLLVWRVMWLVQVYILVLRKSSSYKSPNALALFSTWIPPGWILRTRQSGPPFSKHLHDALPSLLKSFPSRFFDFDIYGLFSCLRWFISIKMLTHLEDRSNIHWLTFCFYKFIK